MHAYFRNHQLYLAEKSLWLERHVIKTSKRALIKIESWKLITQSADQDEQTRLIKKLLKESLLTSVSNTTVLKQEGFYQSNLEN